MAARAVAHAVANNSDDGRALVALSTIDKMKPMGGWALGAPDALAPANKGQTLEVSAAPRAWTPKAHGVANLLS